MNERERNEIAWRTFHLGAQVALKAHGISSGYSAVLQLLGEIARGETTIHDPTRTSQGTGAAAQVVLSIGNSAIRSDRELAEWALAGFDQRTQSETEGATEQ